VRRCSRAVRRDTHTWNDTCVWAHVAMPGLTSPAYSLSLSLSPAPPRARPPLASKQKRRKEENEKKNNRKNKGTSNEEDIRGGRELFLSPPGVRPSRPAGAWGGGGRKRGRARRGSAAERRPRRLARRLERQAGPRGVAGGGACRFRADGHAQPAGRQGGGEGVVRLDAQEGRLG